MNKKSQDRNFQNTTLFRHAGLQEHQIAKLPAVDRGVGHSEMTLGNCTACGGYSEQTEINKFT